MLAQKPLLNGARKAGSGSVCNYVLLFSHLFMFIMYCHFFFVVGLLMNLFYNKLCQLSETRNMHFCNLT